MDLNQLAAMLANLGPWGAVGAFALIYLAPKAIDWIKARFPNVKLPTSPVPAPQPATPSSSPAIVPTLLTMLVDAIKAKIGKANPSADADQVLHELLARELIYGTAGMPAVPVETKAVGFSVGAK